jgi:branched-chain amino acid transport system permease protein
MDIAASISCNTLLSSFAAAAFMILVQEALRFVGLPSGMAANVRQTLYGAALILVIWLQQTKGQERKIKPI